MILFTKNLLFNQKQILVQDDRRLVCLLSLIF